MELIKQILRDKGQRGVFRSPDLVPPKVCNWMTILVQSGCREGNVKVDLSGTTVFAVIRIIMDVVVLGGILLDAT